MNPDNATATTSTRIRNATEADGQAMWRLARDARTLDLNPPYTYLMACRHFGATSVVAEEAGRVVGYCLAYRPPSQPDTVFVWQVTVDPSKRGEGLGGRLLEAVCDLDACSDARFLEATVTPSNEASHKLFGGFARRRGTECVESPCFGADLFPEEAPHSEERLLRIGPL